MDQNSMMGGVPPMPQQDQNTQIQTTPSMVQPAMQGTPYSAPTMSAPTMTPAQNIAMNASSAPAKKNSALMETIVLVFVCIVAATAVVFAVTFFMRWRKLQNSFDAEVAAKVESAKKAQIDADEQKFAEREKEPYSPFTGPDDYGALTFSYPKTWSVYEDKDGMNGGDYVAYFSPDIVRPLSDDSSRYALRFEIKSNKQYSDVAKTYDTAVSNGKLRATPFNSSDGKLTGMRYDGEVSKDMQGTIVIVKVNNNTALFQTDSTEVFGNDFETLINSLRKSE